MFRFRSFWLLCVDAGDDGKLVSSMAKTKIVASLFAEMFSVGLYKRNQGKQVRQVTGVAIAAFFLIFASTLSNNLPTRSAEILRLGLPALIGVLGTWFAYRIVNYAPVADFLIAVQSEMDKVSWPTWPQLWRATVVVLVTMVFLAVSLFLFDIVWQYIFRGVGFLKM